MLMILSHYFDYIFGTSTGGLIAILLGRLRLTVEEALHIYEDFAGEVFGKKRLFSIRSPLLYPRGKYDHRKLEEILKSVVNDAPHVGRSHKFVGGNVFNPDPTFNSEPTLCRTVCVAYMSQGKRKNQPFLFRSYAHADSLNENPDEDSEQAGTRNPGPSHAIPIWKVARATSAAPSYFEPMMIDNHKFLDGALGCNNPSGEAWQELRSMHNGSSKSIGSILSIGTGVSEYDLSGGNGWVKMLQSLSAITKVVTDGLPTHNTMEIVSQSLEFPYLRLAVPGELGDLKMDTWKTDEAQNDETTERSSERRESTAPSAQCQEDFLAITCRTPKHERLDQAANSGISAEPRYAEKAQGVCEKARGPSSRQSSDIAVGNLCLRCAISMRLPWV